MLPPAALLALSLYTSVAGPAPVVTVPTAWVPNPSCAIVYAPALPPPYNVDSAKLACAPIYAPGSAPGAKPASADRTPHVSVGDYTTEGQLQTTSLPSISIPTEGDEAVVLSPDEASLLADLNEERTSRGLSPLDIDPRLVLIAREHSEDMCRRNYFDHMAPQPGPVSPMDRYLASLGQRPDYAMVGENIYYRSITDGLTQSATEANDAFMHSPGHRANILQPLYTKIGIGIYRNPQTGEFWVTQMFLSDSDPTK